jgi:hypothetical protein
MPLKPPRADDSWVRVFHADRAGYIGFGLIFLFVVGMAVVVVVRDTRPATMVVLGLCVAAAVMTWVWLRSFEIRITNDELVFRSLLGGEQRTRHDQILKVRLGLDLSGRGGILRLSIEARGGGQTPPMAINAKVFSREAIRAVLELGERVATVDSGGLEDGIVMRAARRRKPGE